MDGKCCNSWWNNGFNVCLINPIKSDSMAICRLAQCQIWKR